MTMTWVTMTWVTMTWVTMTWVKAARAIKCAREMW